VLVTKTLVIAGEGGTVTMPDKTRGAMLRAYDKQTGAELGAVAMPGAQTGSPMTYMLDGKQYIVVASSSSIMPGQLIAYKLP
jgi:quinoprotein glucose dehydrogenase